MTTWQLTIDCLNPEAQVDFWGPLLGYVPSPPPAGFESWNAWYLSCGVPPEELPTEGDARDRLEDPTGNGPRIWFQPVPEIKSIKNRLHLDIDVTRRRAQPVEERRPLVDAAVAEAVSRGARVIHRLPGDFPEIDDPNGYAVTLADPEGNEFCIS